MAIPVCRVNPHALDDPVNNAFGAWIVWIQAGPKAEMISEQLWAHYFVRGAEGIVCIRCKGRDNLVKQFITVLPICYSDQISDLLCAELADQIHFIQTARGIA